MLQYHNMTKWPTTIPSVHEWQISYDSHLPATVYEQLELQINRHYRDEREKKIINEREKKFSSRFNKKKK